VIYLSIIFFAILEGEIYYSTQCARTMTGDLAWFPVLVAGAVGGAAGDQFWFYLLRGRIHWFDRYPRLARYRARISNHVHSHETGIILVVTPQVSADGFVMLDMFAKSSQADFSRTVDGIPTEISREANSHILIKDGQTVVLGGIYRDTASENTFGIPFLKDLPALGWLFRRVDKKDSREDLLVFLTPRTIGGVSPGLPSGDELWKNRDVARAD